MMSQLLRRQEVESRVRLGTSTIYRRMAAGTFPKPKDLGGGVVRWVEADIEAWIAGRGDAEYRGSEAA